MSETKRSSPKRKCAVDADIAIETTLKSVLRLCCVLSLLFRKHKAAKECKQRQEPVYCVCRKPYGTDAMIQCGECKEWFHHKCMDMREHHLESREKYDFFTCDACAGPCILCHERIQYAYRLWPLQTQTPDGLIVRGQVCYPCVEKTPGIFHEYVFCEDCGRASSPIRPVKDFAFKCFTVGCGAILPEKGYRLDANKRAVDLLTIDLLAAASVIVEMSDSDCETICVDTE